MNYSREAHREMAHAEAVPLVTGKQHWFLLLHLIKAVVFALMDISCEISALRQSIK